MATYSFLDFHGALSGPGANLSLTEGEGIAAEGVTVEPAEDKNIMTVGACGNIMHSLVASTAGILTVRLLKTNPLNAKLQNLYNYQTQSSLYHGKNKIVLRDVVRGDTHSMDTAAFMGRPTIVYAKEGNVMDWKFAGNWHSSLGFGTPSIL